MFYIDYSQYKKRNKFWMIFLLIGLFIVIFIAIFYIYFFVKRIPLNREANGEIEYYGEYRNDEGTIMYQPSYRFKVKNKEYFCSSSISTSNKPSSKSIILYEKGNPDNCLVKNDSNFYYFLLIPVFVGLIFALLGGFFVFKNHKIIKKIKYLSNNGKLVKGIPYTLEDSNVYENGTQLKKIVVNYTLPNGVTRRLVSDLKSNYYGNNDGFVDLLIDPNDENNYFIDFEIR